jgi:hypothetical protein
MTDELRCPEESRSALLLCHRDWLNTSKGRDGEDERVRDASIVVEGE